MKKLLLMTPMLLLTSATLANDNYESAGAASQFIFEMNKDTVMAALLEGGAEGYGRGNLTIAAQGSEQHWFKFSGEYLIEHQD